MIPLRTIKITFSIPRRYSKKAPDDKQNSPMFNVPILVLKRGHGVDDRNFKQIIKLLQQAGCAFSAAIAGGIEAEFEQWKLEYYNKPE